MAAYVDRASGLTCYRLPLLAAFPEVIHGFFTRQGGLSPGPYRSLNLSFAVGDLTENVARNRLRLTAALELKALSSATQVHGSREAVVNDDHQTPFTEIPEVDILITRQPGVGLLIKQADCQAIMLYDPVRRLVANIHCGWRGQVQNLLVQAVQRLWEGFGCHPDDLVAAIGPSLGPCCAEFLNYRQEFPQELWSYQVRPNYFDLWQLSRDQLVAAGLRPDRIEVAGLCTRCQADEFFSYRREKVTGRQGAVIALR